MSESFSQNGRCQNIIRIWNFSKSNTRFFNFQKIPFFVKVAIAWDVGGMYTDFSDRFQSTTTHPAADLVRQVDQEKSSFPFYISFVLFSTSRKNQKALNICGFFLTFRLRSFGIQAVSDY